MKSSIFTGKFVLIFTLILNLFPINALAQTISIPPSVVVNALPQGTDSRPVGYSRIVARLNRGQNWGQIQGGLLCIPAGNLVWRGGQFQVDTGDFEEVFAEEIQNAGFRVARNPNALFNSEDNTAAEVIVAGVIKSASARICAIYSGLGDYDTVKGEILFSMDWEIYSRIEKRVIATLSTRGGFKSLKSSPGGAELLFDSAFSENVRQLINSNEFREAFTSNINVNSNLRLPDEKQKIQINYITNDQQNRNSEDIIGSVVSISSGDGFGSGFLISEDGYLLTNEHVVGQAKFVRIKWSDNLNTVGEVIRVDRARDVAIIKAEPRNRLPLALSTSETEIGAEVRAVGAPFESQLQGSLTRGIVSASRVIEGFRYIQSDVSVNPGNSGGPLLNDENQVIGICVSQISRDRSDAGVNFFIPIMEALRFLNISNVQ